TIAATRPARTHERADWNVDRAMTLLPGRHAVAPPGATTRARRGLAGGLWDDRGSPLCGCRSSPLLARFFGAAHAGAAVVGGCSSASARRDQRLARGGPGVGLVGEREPPEVASQRLEGVPLAFDLGAGPETQTAD